jgi:hypothetical protein
MTSYSSLRELNQSPGEDRDHRHPAAVAPELLVGYGFRGWIAGYQTGDVQFWERVWRLYSNILRPPAATGAVDYLASWAKSVNASSRRSVEISPLEACEFCRDECLAISLIAASQHQTCPAMRACAFALIDSSLLDDVLYHTETFAVTMRSYDKIVSPEWIVNANAFVDPSVTIAS